MGLDLEAIKRGDIYTKANAVAIEHRKLASWSAGTGVERYHAARAEAIEEALEGLAALIAELETARKDNRDLRNELNLRTMADAEREPEDAK